MQKSSYTNLLKFIWQEKLPQFVAEVAFESSGFIDDTLALGSQNAIGFYSNSNHNINNLNFDSQIIDQNTVIDFPIDFNLIFCSNIAHTVNEENLKKFIANISLNCQFCIFNTPVKNQLTNEEMSIFDSSIWSNSNDNLTFYTPKQWASLFKIFGMDCYDLRKIFWDDASLPMDFRQNFLFFATPTFKSEHLSQYKNETPLHLIHPEILEKIFNSK